MNTSKTQKEVINQMQEGFDSLEHFYQQLELSVFQKLKIKMIILSVLFYKVFILPFQKKKKIQLQKTLESYQNMPLNVQRTHLKASEGNYYLSEEEIQNFEKDGLIKPFRVISSEEAAALKEEINDQVDKDFEGKHYLGDEITATLKKHNSFNLTSGGLYQALRLKNFRDLLRKPQIAQRLASLIGEEVLCWRSQFFEKKPNSIGTFWHQNSLFREVSKDSKLVPTKEVDAPIVQLTAWVALSDVNIKNGALRLMPGSFQDSRLEFMYNFAQDNLILFLSQVPINQLKIPLTAATFSTGSFIRTQAVFNIVTAILPDLFKNSDIVDLTMKAGECVIFTSSNMHASFPNITEDDTRFAFVGRCTANHVKVFPNTNTSTYATADGIKEFELPEYSSFQVHGKDSYGYNKILKEEAALKVSETV